MAARCLFYLPHLDPPCEVIRMLAMGDAVIELFAVGQWQLCRTNAYIECPVFRYLEQVYEASWKEAAHMPTMEHRSEP
jgi:hypothetical protein